MNTPTSPLVVIYSVSPAEWYIAEVNGAEVVQLGPFDSEAVVDDLLPNLYPRERTVELPEQPAKLNNETVTILGNAAARDALRQATAAGT